MQGNRCHVNLQASEHCWEEVLCSPVCCPSSIHPTPNSQAMNDQPQDGPWSWLKKCIISACRYIDFNTTEKTLSLRTKRKFMSNWASCTTSLGSMRKTLILHDTISQGNGKGNDSLPWWCPYLVFKQKWDGRNCYCTRVSRDNCITCIKECSPRCCLQVSRGSLKCTSKGNVSQFSELSDGGSRIKDHTPIACSCIHKVERDRELNHCQPHWNTHQPHIVVSRKMWVLEQWGVLYA